jgi:CRP/FNR family nitrogen fixation transcriptional regulator
MYASAQTTSHQAVHHPAMAARAPHARPRRVALLPADTEVYAQGERSGTLYHIEFGAVRVFRLLADGRRQIVAFHLAGETFGLETDRSRGFFAETTVETALRTMEAGEYDACSPELMASALRGMVRAQKHLLVVGKQSAVEKLAVFLLDIAERQGDCDKIDLPMTRNDIGDYLGMTIETVSRNLSRLRALGVVRLVSNRCVELMRPEHLRKLCQ